VRALCFAAYAISVLVLILTQSRGSWLGFLVAHGVWLFYAHRKLFLPAVAALAVLMVAAYSASLLPRALGKRIEDTLRPGPALYSRGLGGHFDSSVNIRVAIHAMALDIFSESPIWGHGFGSFQRLAVEHGAKHGLWSTGGSVAAESVILNTAVESGLIGLFVFAWLCWILVTPGFELLSDPEERSLALAFLAAFAAIFVESLTQIALFLPEISLPFWLMGGMLWRAHDEAKPSTTR
jgi:putative inorganic carbon (HCO3(-)) transporter